MDQVIQMLFEMLMNTAIGPYLTLVALFASVITHLVPHLPPALTEKLPNWVMVIINSVAGQYRNAKNMATNIKGNRRNGSNSSNSNP